MRPLVINEAVKADVNRVKEYAHANPVRIASVVRTAGGSRPPVGDNKEHACVLPMGYRCVFSIEEQPMGFCRHLSVSVPEKGKAPNENAVLELMKLFGFKATAYGPGVMVWLEDISNDFKAVNVLEPLVLPDPPKEGK
jgi:hypothetical protein